MRTDIDYGFTDYLHDLWNLMKIRGNMSTSTAAREVLELREEAYLAYLDGESVQDFYNDLAEDRDE